MKSYFIMYRYNSHSEDGWLQDDFQGEFKSFLDATDYAYTTFGKENIIGVFKEKWLDALIGEEN